MALLFELCIVVAEADDPAVLPVIFWFSSNHAVSAACSSAMSFT